MRRIGELPCKQRALLLFALLLATFFYLTSMPESRAAPASSSANQQETASPCAPGNALKELGRLDAAEAAFLEALKAKGGVECAVAPLEALGRRETICAKAEALTKAGQGKEAEEALVKVLEAEPNSSCPAKLDSLEEAQSPWEWAATATKDALAVIVALLLGLAILFVLAALILRLLRVCLFPPTLQVKALDNGGNDNALGTGLTALIGGRISRRRDKGADLVTGRASLGESLEPLGDIATEAKAAVSVIAVFSKLLLHKNFDLSGTVQQKGGNGCGISLQFTEGNGVVDVATFWANDFKAGDDEVEAYQRLAIPAAAWVDHVLATALGNQEELLSKDARSWALFEAASERQQEGDEDEAAELYEDALDFDPDNAGALANLGVIRTRNYEYERAATLLERARALLEGN